MYLTFRAVDFEVALGVRIEVRMAHKIGMEHKLLQAMGLPKEKELLVRYCLSDPRYP